MVNILPYKQIDVIVTVKHDNNVFDVANELQNLGLIVDTVLLKTRCVMGACSQAVLERIQASELLELVETETE